MSKYTPGPWEVREETQELQVIGYIKGDYSSNPKREDGLWPEVVMIIKAGRRGAKRGGTIRYVPFDEKQKANARLSAAAPELLEACKFTLEGFREISEGRFTLQAGTIDKLKQAIVKAEGEN